MGFRPQVDPDQIAVCCFVGDLDGILQQIAGHGAFQAIEQVGIGVGAVRSDGKPFLRTLKCDIGIRKGRQGQAHGQCQRKGQCGKLFEPVFHLRTSLVSAGQGPAVSSIILHPPGILNGLCRLRLNGGSQDLDV